MRQPEAHPRLTIVSLNVRGLIDNSKRQDYIQLFQQHLTLAWADILLLQETAL